MVDVASVHWQSACYVAIGFVLFLVNALAFSVIIFNKDLRVIFAVISALFFAGALTGVAAVFKGVQWFRQANMNIQNDRIINSFTCLKHVSAECADSIRFQFLL
ncbi:unnamed protein product [Anisakis simplex]|uniref:Inner membrane protein n=1 Tax=Anisakis simplex TaxID=6269 RepID=A0A0M3KAX1_ANISI|nr:unnamed protein product [Anisakis simplex]